MELQYEVHLVSITGPSFSGTLQLKFFYIRPAWDGFACKDGRFAASYESRGLLDSSSELLLGSFLLQSAGHCK